MGKVIRINPSSSRERPSSSFSLEPWQDKIITLHPCVWPKDHNIRLVYPVETVNLGDPERLTEITEAMATVRRCPHRKPEGRIQNHVYRCNHPAFEPRKPCPNKSICHATERILIQNIDQS